MSKHKFKVGDKVRLKKDLVIGKKYGGITFLTTMQNSLDSCGGESCIVHITPYGSCVLEDDKHGFLFSPKMLDFVPEKIIIYRNGAEVVAKNTATGKTGIAKCNPADEFDFNTGARLAFDRLTAKEPEQPKYYNHKVVCVKAKTPMFTTGKIYEVKDGYLRNDCNCCEAHRAKSIKELNEHQISDFIELIEE